MANRMELGVDLITRLKDKGFRDLEKSSKKQSAAMGLLAKRLAAVFSVAAIIRFGKTSIKAFQESQKEANKLRAQLESLNLGFAQLQMTQMIEKVQLATGRSGGELTDAFVKLSQATLDVTNAQRLFRIALDISAAEGKDLNAVAVALQRAHGGQLTALTRLQIGFTAANLKGREFEDVLADLEMKYAGSSARAAETLEGKVLRLKEAVGEAQEAFGKGFVESLEQSKIQVQELQKFIIGLGTSLGNLAGRAISFQINAIKDVYQELEKKRGGRILGPKVPSRELQEEFRISLRIRKQEEKDEARRLAYLKRLRELQEKERKAAEVERLRNKVSYKFDMEAINIAAALRRTISAEDKQRLLELQALKKSEYESDEEAIKTLQKVANNLPDSKAKIIFTDNLDEINSKLQHIIKKDYIVNLKVLQEGAVAVAAPGKAPGIAFPDPGGWRPGERDSKMLPAAIASVAFPDLDVGEMARDKRIAADMPKVAFSDPGGWRPGERNDPVVVNVNIEGSLLSQQDLVAAVTDAVYQTQRVGNDLVLEAI